MYNAQANVSDRGGVNSFGSVNSGPDVQLVQLNTDPSEISGAMPAYPRQDSGPVL